MSALAARLGMSERELRSVPVTYYTFHLPKRTGGARTITAPNAGLKSVQRRILRRLLARLSAHPCAAGFERERSIVTHALPHVGQEVVIKLDLKDFFGSTSAARVEAFFRRVGWDAEAAALLTRLCTHDGALPQGAPTSPRLSNLLNHALDVRLACSRGAAYSRYADDITFSGPADAAATTVQAPSVRRRTNPKTREPPTGGGHRINDLIHASKRIVADEGYVLHTSKKLRITRRHQRQVVTGLVVNEKVQLPRATRRWLRAIEHRQRTTGAATLSASQLEGWRALQSMIATQASPA
jgi:retron-type reverse transcriptase